MPSVTEIDLQPDPRILPMLGEINLAQWRCIAELVDNSVDGFLSQQRAGAPPINPEVSINLPMRDDPSAVVSVTDNGPGMAIDVLERAVKAGWSGNNAVDSLGMFGMGFNIATARLGTVTTVWTSRAGDQEEHGITIDFAQLTRQRHFKTPLLRRPKQNITASGTTVIIERLKPEQRGWFAKASNRSAVREELSKSYSAMLRQTGVPISFKLVYCGRRVPSRSHCVWDESRQTQTPRHGVVRAVQKIDRRLPDRPFCNACWQWLTVGEPSCPTCGTTTDIIQRSRRVHGWVGLQRFLSTTAYGIDFIRNGRKIEIANRDLFVWKDPTTATEEIEYPIDDPRQRGRFVGEIHLDHARVTYMKDRFDRTDPAWDEMVGIVRGEGPLQPQKAAGLGYGGNDSPLYRLYQAFRRSSPKGRVAGGWADVLVVKDNDKAEEFAKKFYEADPEYLPDTKWWDLIVEEDNKLLTPQGRGFTASPAQGGQPTPANLGGFAPAIGTSTPIGAPAPPANPPAPPQRTPIPSLTQEFRHDGTGLRWEIRAFEALSSDAELGRPAAPWSLRKLPDGKALFVIDRTHPIFRSSTMTELDALLCEIAYKTADYSRNDIHPPSFAQVLADLRDRYGGSLKLDGAALAGSVEQLLRSIAKAWPAGVDAMECNQLYSEMPSADREAIQHKMAARSVTNPQQQIAEGRFLEYAPASALCRFVSSHPEHFFDGKCWEDAYATLDYMHPAATEQARRDVIAKYEALLWDVTWLAEQDPADIETFARERVLRAAIAIELLAPSPTRDD